MDSEREGLVLGGQIILIEGLGEGEEGKYDVGERKAGIGM